MSDFNPDSYLASVAAPTQQESSSFNPDAYLSANVAPPSQEEQYGTPTEMVKTGLEGAARGATFGLSDLAESKILGNAREIKARKDVNPGTSTASQIGGAIAPALLTGGFVPLAESIVGTGVAGRIMGSAIEGATAAATNVNSDLILGEPNVTAQKIMGDIGLGAILGGSLGAISKGAELLQPQVFKTVNKGIEKLEGFLKPGAKEAAKDVEKLFPSLKDQALGALATTALGVPSHVVKGTIAAINALHGLKTIAERGPEAAAAIAKLQIMANMAEKVTDKITTLSKSVINSTPGRIAEIGAVVLPSTRNYDKRVGRINELMDSPETMIDHLMSLGLPIQDAAPNIVNSLNNAVANSIQFLHSKIPMPPSHLPLSNPDWEASRAQKDKFNTYYDTVDNPLSVYKSLKSGTISGEEIEALASVHPDLLNEMRSTLIEHMDPKKARNMPYGVKMGVAKFLGGPLDENMTPAAVQTNQLSLKGGPQSQQMGQGGKPTAAGMKNLDAAERAQTESQELEQPE